MITVKKAFVKSRFRLLDIIVRSKIVKRDLKPPRSLLPVTKFRYSLGLLLH